MDSPTIAQVFDLCGQEDKLHPEAIKKYREFIDDIAKETPLGEITEDDAKKYLTEYDFHSFEDEKKSLAEWLAKCLLINAESTLSVYPFSFPIWGTLSLKNLLGQVYKQKKAEQKHREFVEQARFQAYLDQQRKDREWAQATREHEVFLANLNQSLADFKASLQNLKEPQFTERPKWLMPFRPGLWVDLPFPPKDWMTLEMKASIVVKKSLLLPALLRHVDYKLIHHAWYIPSVKYELVEPALPSYPKGKLTKPENGIPCLRWEMATYIRTTAEFSESNGTIIDERYGYKWELQSTRENLGKLYQKPVFWQNQTALFTPLSLVAMLAWGKPEMEGVVTVMRDKPWTAYKITGFPDEVSIHDDLKGFIRTLTKKHPLDKAFLNCGMCDEDTARLVKVKIEQLKDSLSQTSAIQPPQKPDIQTGDDLQDLINALANLGYSKTEAVPVAKQICQKYPDEPMENKVTLALQFLTQ